MSSGGGGTALLAAGMLQGMSDLVDDQHEDEAQDEGQANHCFGG